MIATSFKEAIIEMMAEIAKQIPDSHKRTPVKAYLTGGGAVHYYCNSRVSDDVDLIMQFSVKIPEDLFVVWLNEEGSLEQVHYDTIPTTVLLAYSMKIMKIEPYT